MTAPPLLFVDIPQQIVTEAKVAPEIGKDVFERTAFMIRQAVEYLQSQFATLAADPLGHQMAL